MSDQEFYELAWNTLPHRCEECGMYLQNFSRGFVSHILTKGAYPSYRHDIRNVNILCQGPGTNQCHEKWEFGSRKSMKIWGKNEETMITLKHEYYDGQQRSNR